MSFLLPVVMTVFRFAAAEPTLLAATPVSSAATPVSPTASVQLAPGVPVPAAADSVRWILLRSGVTASLRGLYPVSRHVVWATGEGGTVLRTVDGGGTWTRLDVPGAADLDFRDVFALDARRAWVLSAGQGESSRIYATDDGGATWTRLYTEARPAGFLDGLAFWDGKRGLAFGDQIDGRLEILRTEDGGRTWHQVRDDRLPPALPREAGFAASGTALVTGPDGRAWIGTGGGGVARVFRTLDYGRSWSVAATPLPADSSSSGIFSLAFRDGDHGIAVGGDYRLPEGPGTHVAVTADGGATWRPAFGPAPVAYLSGVAFAGEGTPPPLIAVGTAGSFLSLDGGRAWRRLGRDGWHVVAFAPGTRIAWAAGADGHIGRIDLPATP